MSMQATAERSGSRVSDEPQPYLLSAEGISKSFPGVLALDNVSFHLRRGSVHALMGENGAGKSTLMKILAGIYQPDHGELRMDGAPVQFKAPLDALEKGVAMIHQELNLMASMTVAENIWIRREPRNWLGFVDHREMNRLSRDLLQRLKIDLDPETEVRHLSIASRQMVEIVKAVSYRSRVLIMDEPTSALTERESAQLFNIIADLKSQGIGIVYISHKMSDIFTVADEISVFRDGKFIATQSAHETSRDAIIRMMVGRDISQMFPKEDVVPGDILLSATDLTLDGVFSNVSFELRAGEILGFAGLIGSGRSNVAETLFGVTPATGGQIRVKGEPVDIRSPGHAIRQGMAFLTEDRKQSGCLLVLDILQNMQLAALQSGYATVGFVKGKAIYAACSQMSKKLRIKMPGMGKRLGPRLTLGRW